MTERDPRTQRADDERELGSHVAACLALEADLSEDPRGAAGWLDALHDERNDAAALWQVSITHTASGEPAVAARVRATWPMAEATDEDAAFGVWLIPLDEQREAELDEDGWTTFERDGMTVSVEMP